MLKSCLFVTLAALACAAATRQVVYLGDLSPLNIVPTLDNGYVIALEGNGRIAVYGADGSRLYEATIQVANAKFLTILNAAADADGTVAVIFRNPEGFAVVDRAGKQLRTVTTGRYTPKQICFAPDHTIWLAGDGPLNEDYMIFRHYSTGGHELGQFIHKSEFSSYFTVESIGGRAMRASKDRIVALFQLEADPGQMEWIELDFSGQLIDRLGRHPWFFPWALTSDGTIYARQPDSKFLFFDRSAAQWKPVSFAPGYLLGADETGLVFQLSGSNTLEWRPLN
jgi:hypothetical protein